MVIAALLTRAPTWTISTCLSALEQTAGCSHSEMFSNGREHTIATYVNMMIITNIILSESSQTLECKVCNSINSKSKTKQTPSILSEVRRVVTLCGRMNRTGYQGGFLDAAIFHFLIWVLVIRMCHFYENSSGTSVLFAVCMLYFNDLSIH